MRHNLTIEEFMEITEYKIIPPETTGLPEWLTENEDAVAVYMAAQLGPRVMLKKYDPDDPSVFDNWYMLQLISFASAHDFEFSKKYALLDETYAFDSDGGYHKEGDNTFTPDTVDTFTPGTTTTFGHTDDKTTHSERTYENDVITPISSDERTGSSSTSYTGFDTTAHTGENVTEYHEDVTEKRNPQEAIMAERSIAMFSLVIEIATRFTNSITYSNWEV